MSNFSIGNGCNSCSEVGGSFNNLPPMGQLLNNDNTSNYLSNMVSQNVANNNNNMYYNNNNNNNGYNTPVNNVANNLANNVANSANQVNALINASNNGRNVTAIPNTINVNANANNAAPANNVKFAPSNVVDNRRKGMSQSAIYFVMMAFVFIAALSWNDAIRYFINQSIKFNSGKPSYYIFYAVLMTILAAVVFNYSQKN